MNQEEKRVIRRTKRRFMIIMSIAVALVLAVAILFQIVYTRERRILAGRIELNAKIPMIVQDNYSDRHSVGTNTQEHMFIVIEDDSRSKGYSIPYGRAKYGPFIEENIDRIMYVEEPESIAIIGDFLVTLLLIDDNLYYARL